MDPPSAVSKSSMYMVPDEEDTSTSTEDNEDVETVKTAGVDPGTMV